MSVLRRILPKVATRLARYLLTRVAAARVIVSCDFPGVLMPWSKLRRDASPVAQLRRLAVDAAWESISSLPDKTVFWLYSVAWPVTAAFRALRVVKRQGPSVRAQTGMNAARQWWDCVSVAIRYNYSPYTYFRWRFFERQSIRLEYIQGHEFTLLQRRDIGALSTNVTRQKLKFFEECKRLGISTPQVVAVFRKSSDDHWCIENAATLPHRNLFLKWEDGEQGKGAERWEYDSAHSQWVRRGIRRNYDEMLAYCRARADERGLLVQHCEENHPEIQRMGSTALCTLRVITCRAPDAPVQLVRVMFKLARRGADVDNVSEGAVACPVDIETGALGAACGAHPSDGVHTHHPDSEVQVQGRVLPHFHDAIALAFRAHGQMQLPWSVGWDVAISPNGPTLVEGNAYWAPPGAAPLPPPFIAALHSRLAC